MSQNHLIHRYVAEVDFHDKNRVQPLFDEVSKLINTRFTDITNRVFDRVAPDDNYIRIENLDINLGSLSYPLNETECMEKYEAALEKVLLERVDKITAPGSDTPGDEVSHNEFKMSNLSLLHHYLLRGYILNHITNDSTSTPADLFTDRLAADRAGLKNILVQTGMQDVARKRLAYQFNDSIIKSTISLIEPSQADFITSYHHDISTLQHQKQLVKAESRSFEQSLWYFILTYLMVDMGGHFHRKMFVKSTLSQMAAHYNLSYEEVLDLFAKAVRQPVLIVAGNSLQSIVIELKEEKTDRSSTINESNITGGNERNVDENPMEVALHFLLHGALPYRYQHYNPETLEQAISMALEQHPGLIRPVLANHQAPDLLSHRLSQLFSDEILSKLVSIKEPAEASFITSYHKSVMGVQRKKHIVKAEETDFRKLLWEFIFSYLLNDRGSLFNTRSFVEQNIRRLANHYNMDFRTTLLFLTQGIGESMMDVGTHSTLFHVFAQILQEQSKDSTNTITGELANPVEQIDHRNDSLQDIIATRNTLLFWLTNGRLPWWSEIAGSKPHAIMEQFAKHQPREAAELLHVAMHKGLARGIASREILPSLKHILGQLPGGQEALDCIRDLEYLHLENSNVPMHDALPISILLAYHASGFRSFSSSEFLHRLIDTLGYKANKQTISTTRELHAALASKTSASTNILATKLEEIVKHGVQHLPSSLYNEELVIFDKQSLHVDGMVFNTLPPAKQAKLALEWISYFLQHDHFPALLDQPNEKQTLHQLRYLVMLIFNHDAAQLRNLLGRSSHSPRARMKLHDIFAPMATGHTQQTRNMATLLQTFAEQDIQHYITSVFPGLSQSMQIESLVSWMEAHVPVQKRAATYKTLLASAPVARILSSKMQDDAFNGILQYLTDDQTRSTIKDFAHVLSLVAVDSFERGYLQQYLREFSISWFTTRQPGDFSQFATSFFLFLARNKQRDIPRLFMQFNKVKIQLAGLHHERLQAAFSILHNACQPLADNHVRVVALEQKHEKAERASLEATTGVTIKNIQTNNQPEEQNIKKEQATTKHDSILVPNAGLVLLNPFITTYLDRLEVCHDKEFVNQDAQHRATHLLQYLVNNAEATPETDMVLNKVLCGITIDKVIPDAVTLTDNEKETATQLLMAVIQNWDKLKNTSLEGLQVSFLQRDGMLTELQDCWKLAVSPRAYDILLQTLPWGLSMIKYPWMQKPLMIDWK